MATWTEIKEWLFEQEPPELSRLEPVLVPAAQYEDGWLEELSVVEDSLRSDVDAIALEFSETAFVGPLDPTIRCLMALRMEFARSLVIALSAAEERGELNALFRMPRAQTRNSRVRWLLIDAWAALGCHQWEAVGYWLGDWRALAEEQLVREALAPGRKTRRRKDA